MSCFLRLGLFVVITASSMIGALAEECTVKDLQDALRAHDGQRIAFQYKMQTGYIRRASRGDIAASSQKNLELYGNPFRMLAAVVRHLKTLDSSGRAAALIYDPRQWQTSTDPRSFQPCAWLVTGDGALTSARTWAAHRSPGLDWFKEIMGRRSATRRPRLRADGPDRPTVAPAQDTTRSLEQLDMIWWQMAEQLLPAEISRRIAHDVSLLLVLPAGELSTVPFAALPVPGTELRLVDTVTPIVLTSVDGLFFWVKRVEQLTPALLVGDPDLTADPKWVFPSLPGARREAEQVAGLLRTRAVVGGNATLQTVRRALEDKRLSLIYFATHGLSDAKDPMDASFLALARGHLTGSAIKSLRFSEQHPLVVMSACQTGLGKVFDGGVFGLARAWIYAGASQVVASHWNVDDAATERLMVGFVRRLVGGEETAAALRLAILDVRRVFPDPALWGAFSLFGYPQPKP